VSAHTPGPWMVGGPFPAVSVCFESIPGDGETPPVWEPVCVVDQRTQGPQDPRALADARLIAAAPELLAALETLLDSEMPVWRSGEVARVWRKASQAVAKARGER
jgi:hypothetical protein